MKKEISTEVKAIKGDIEAVKATLKDLQKPENLQKILDGKIDAAKLRAEIDGFKADLQELEEKLKAQIESEKGASDLAKASIEANKKAEKYFLDNYVQSAEFADSKELRQKAIESAERGRVSILRGATKAERKGFIAADLIGFDTSILPAAASIVVEGKKGTSVKVLPAKVAFALDALAKNVDAAKAYGRNSPEFRDAVAKLRAAKESAVA